MKKLLIILLSPFALKAQNTFYVSTTGSGGNGSIGSPWDLQTALNDPVSVVAGDTIYIQAGTYTGTYTSDLTGTAPSPIIVKAIGRAIIDGTRSGQANKNIPALDISGAYTWYIGLEVTNSDPDRTGPFNGLLARGIGVNSMDGIGIKVINCIIYDTGQGLDAWTPATNTEFYGNVIFNNGWVYPTNELTGHGIYTQNDVGTKSYKENIILNNFGFGFHIYAEAGVINNFFLEGNVEFNDRWLMGGFAPLTNITLNSNFSYKHDPEIGYLVAANDGITLTNNFFPGYVHFRWCTNVTATGNTIFAYKTPDTPVEIIFEGPEGPPDLSTFTFDNNVYYWDNISSTNNFYFYWDNSLIASGPGNSGIILLPAWRALGKDVNSTFVLFPKVGNELVLSGKKTFVRPNTYDENRANVIIYNWDLSNTVNVNVAGILSSGDTYELRNVQDYFGDVITGEFAGGDSLSVPMTGHTVALPLGHGTAMGLNTFPEFGTFVLINTSEEEQPQGTILRGRNLLIE